MIEIESIQIQRVSAIAIRPLRHRILRAGLPPEAAVFDHDEDETTFHAGAIASDDGIVGCATIMLLPHEEHPAWKLRGMAVDVAFRRFGIGRRLLAACDCHAILHGPPRLWCNARTPAVPFYRSLGWSRDGDEFEIPTAGPHYRMIKILQNQ